MGLARTLLKGVLKGTQRTSRSSRNHLYPSIRQVPDPAGENQPSGLPENEISVPDPLHHAAHGVLPGHSTRLDASQPFTTSTHMGRMDTPMIPMTTRLKFCRTSGRLPKK